MAIYSIENDDEPLDSGLFPYVFFLSFASNNVINHPKKTPFLWVIFQPSNIYKGWQTLLCYPHDFQTKTSLKIAESGMMAAPGIRSTIRGSLEAQHIGCAARRSSKQAGKLNHDWLDLTLFRSKKYMYIYICILYIYIWRLSKIPFPGQPSIAQPIA